MSSRLANLEANYALFVSLGEAARKELAAALDKIGGAVLAAQREAAPVRTGKLRDALSIAEAVELLRVRIGYPDLKRGRDPRFYAVFQEFGVAAGAKMVTRVDKRGGRTVKVGRYKAYARLTYPLTWPNKPARPFVRIGDRVDGLIDASIAGFWDTVLNRVGAE